jgi:hypothetical protein
VRLTAKKNNKFLKAITTSILNWPVKTLIVGLFSASLFSSCSDPSNIGLELDPNSNQIGVYYTEIPLTASMIMLDSINTTNSGSFVFGGKNSEFFGKIDAIAFSRMYINSILPLPASDAVLDSVKFNFRVGSVLADNLGTPKTINVHFMNEPIQDISYFNKDRLSFEPTPFVKAKFNFSAKQDTLVSVKINNNLASSLFQEMKKASTFNDIFSFREFIKGIAFTGENGEETSFSLRPGNSTGFVVFYKNPGDTVQKIYPISTSQSRHFNYAVSDRRGTPTEKIVEAQKPYEVGDKVGILSNVGLTVKINTLPLEQMMDTLKNAVFNEVRLEIGPLNEVIASNSPPNLLQLYFFGANNRLVLNSFAEQISVQADGQPQLGKDANNKPTPFAPSPAFVAFNTERKTYSQSITSYSNAVYRLGLQRTDFMLYPRLRNASSGAVEDAFNTTLREVIFDQRTIKLKIFYSKTKSL